GTSLRASRRRWRPSWRRRRLRRARAEHGGALMTVPGGSAPRLPRSAIETVKLGWQASRLQLAWIVGLSGVIGLVPVGSAWSARALLDVLTRHPIVRPALVPPVVALAVFGAATLAGGDVLAYMQTVMQRSIRVAVQARLFNALHAIPGLAAFEDP